MKAFLLSLLFLMSSVAFADATYSDSNAVNFSKTNYSFVLSWVDGPKRGVSHFIMKSFNRDSGTISGPFKDLPYSLHVYLWMPSMGHGSAPVKITKINDGEYDVSQVQFIMGGKWDVRFQLKDGNTVVEEVIVPVAL